MPANNRRAASSVAANIGAKVRAQRVSKRMSREHLGREIGKTGQQIARYENGENEIKMGVLKKMADALGCSEHDFLEPRNDGGF